MTYFLLCSLCRLIVYELAKTLPEYGVGSKFAKQKWLDGEREHGATFWTLKMILPRPDGRTGKGAWGVLTWKGKALEKTERIKGTHKRSWCVVGESYRDVEEEEEEEEEEDIVVNAVPVLDLPSHEEKNKNEEDSISPNQ